MRQQVEGAGRGTDLAGGDPQVASRGCEASVTEQQLNGAQIGTGFEQMDGKGVAQRMRCDGLGESGESMGLLTCVLDRLSRDRVVGLTAREQPLLRVHSFPVATQDIQQLRREHDVAIFTTFALLDADHHPAAVDSGRFQANRLRDPQAGSVTGGEDHPMFAGIDAFEEVDDFFRAQL